MFFFIGGIQPKTTTIGDQPRICPSCGLYQAHLKRVDHYLSFFFVPILRVKKGAPFLECQRCGSVSTESGEVWTMPWDKSVSNCPNCGKPLKQEFRYCPFCGNPR